MSGLHGFPLRTVQVVVALLDAQRTLGNAPLAAYEVCPYDSDAKSVRATAAALRAARSVALVESLPAPPGSSLGTIWWPTGRARELFGGLDVDYPTADAERGGES